MKKIIYTSVALLLLGFTVLPACNKLKELAKVNLTLDNAKGEFDMPELTAIGEVNLGTADTYINLDSLIKAENSDVSANNIRSVHMKSCTLVLTNGTAINNFSALESCKLEIKSNKKTDYVQMASVTNNPDVEAYSLNMPVDQSIELKDYFLNANVFTIKVSGKNRKMTTQPLHCRVELKYTLEAGL